MWNVIRIAYFDNDKSALLQNPVKDVVEHIQQLDLRVFMTSHWKFGPHVDLVVDCDVEQFNNDIFPYAKQHIESWLADNPATAELNAQEYERLSYQLAMSELEPPPYLPLLENNQVTVGLYQRSQAINIAGFHDTKEQFLVDSTGLLFHLMGLKKANSDVFFVCLIFMMASVAAKFKPDGIKRGYISYRSHAEYFFENFDKQDALRGKFDLLDKKYAPLIDSNLPFVVDDKFTEMSLPPSVQSMLQYWNHIVVTTFDNNRQVVDQNYEQIIREDSEVSSTEQNFADLAESVSSQVPEDVNKPSRDYNTGKVVNTALQHEEGRQLFRSHDFITYRTTVNYFYLLLPVLDITPVQKFSLCHIIANSVERVYGISWKDVIPSAVGGENE
ncbi:hypothetical protein KIH87_06790 [Paraneptunicella aestuarii]|uniref:lantibiotic dehydratase C-terminal domain-containing protein n=1 Tax=Paraneptunicella aestuarii TaxID=2831148 RepID=UPI001E61E3CE|nr:lantibiotic dehydratase C-terminal domain-containing protein [Paraneptunicella aestuarii]UAA40051.1 hypothetical protein KIH87_06790 [Paraneptunicella aestuarii]